jgi:hypothetical protein
MGIKQRNITKSKVDNWYNRMATKTKEWREREEEEDLSIIEWIDLLQEWKKKENERGGEEKL